MLARCSYVVPSRIVQADTRRNHRWRSNSIMNPIPPWIVCDNRTTASHFSLQSALAWEHLHSSGQPLVHFPQGLVGQELSSVHPDDHVGTNVRDGLERSMGRPKAVRFFEYSMAISASFLAAPTICVHSRTVARSSMRSIRRPAEIQLAHQAGPGTRRSLSVTSLCLSFAIVRSGMWEMPGEPVSTRNSEIPSFARDFEPCDRRRGTCRRR